MQETKRIRWLGVADMKERITGIISFLIFSILGSGRVFAHCPLCTGITAAAVATARVAGVDDIIVGTFAGALKISTAFWMSKYLSKRFGAKAVFNPYVLSAASLILTVGSLYVGGVLGTVPAFTYVFGVERLLFGMVFGTATTLFSFQLHSLLRSLNSGKNHFPMQGIVVMLAILALADLGLYLAGIV